MELEKTFTSQSRGCQDEEPPSQTQSGKVVVQTDNNLRRLDAIPDWIKLGKHSRIYLIGSYDRNKSSVL